MYYGLTMSNLPKIVIILGPTASGKTDLGIALAREFGGEIINADSRQVYKEMDIATAKPPKDVESKKGEYLVNGIAHHLMDIIKPSKEFSLADFKEKANGAIADILSRGKLPIVVGGTGLYIWSLVENLDIPKVAPNKKLRKGLEEKPLSELVKLLQNIDPDSAKKVDLKNPRRVLRALEVAISTGESFVSQTTKSQPLYDILQIGISCPRETLFERINARVDAQIQNGLEEETKKLAKKYPWHLPSMSGIGYRQLGAYLRSECDLKQAIERIKIDTRHYAKRQMTWFARDKKIQWVEKDVLVRAKKLTGDFVNKKQGV